MPLAEVALFQTFSRILKSNKTLEKIRLDIGELQPPIDKLFDSEQVENFNVALAYNTTLKEFVLHIKPRAEDRAHVREMFLLIHDSRVRIISPA